MSEQPFDVFALVGAVLDGQYRVERVAGEGTFGVVYRGWHLRFEQPVAIKALKLPETVGPGLRQSLLAKFHEEARLSYMLSQQSLDIVRSIGFGELTTPSGIWAPYLVLEWLEGKSLGADLDERRVRGEPGRTLEQAIELLAPAARGLAYAHSKRVAHRDVKPANMFMTTLPGPPEQRTLKLVDFGIAKLVADGTKAGTAAVQATAFSSFTPYYAAPEQLDPRLGATGPWTDVYSLALVLTEVLSGRPANSGDVMTLFREAADPQHRPTPRARGVPVTDAVQAVCARALEVDPRSRYPDATTFWEALQSAARDTVARPAPRPFGGGLSDSAIRTAAMPASAVSPRVETTQPMAAVLPRAGSHGTQPMPAVTPSAPSVVAASSGGLPSLPTAAAPLPVDPSLRATVRFDSSPALPVAPRPPAGPSATFAGGATAPALNPRKRRRRPVLVACIVGATLGAVAFAALAARAMGAW